MSEFTDDIIDGMIDGLSEEESQERAFATIRCRNCGHPYVTEAGKCASCNQGFYAKD